MCDRVRCATSARYTEALLLAPPALAAEITQIEARLKAKWISTVQAKLEYYNHVPYKLCGGFAAYCGHTLNEAKACVKASFEEFDSIADLSQAHYVALNLCGRESSASQQLFDFCQSPTTNLHDYPEAFQALQQYSFCSCAERATEREHVMLRVATTRGLTYCKPASAWHRAGAVHVFFVRGFVHMDWAACVDHGCHAHELVRTPHTWIII